MLVSARRVRALFFWLAVLGPPSGAALPTPALAQRADLNQLWKRVLELEQAGRIAEALPLAEKLVEEARRQVGPSQPGTASMLTTLGNIYKAADRLRDAEAAYRLSLATWERAVGPNHPEAAGVLNNIAGLLWAQGRLHEAEPEYKRAIAIYSAARGNWRAELAITTSNLGRLSIELGKHEEAERLLRQGLALSEQQHGPEHPAVASVLTALGKLYKALGRPDEAGRLYARALPIQEKALGPRHPDVADTLNNLAGIARDQGRFAEADAGLQRSLAIRRERFGPSHSLTSASLQNLAELYRRAGRFAEALPLMQQSLAILEQLHGAGHPDLALAREGLALVLAELKRYAEAEPLLRQSLADGERSLGAAHPSVATTLRNLGVVHNRKGEHEAALAAFRRAAAIYAGRAVAAAARPGGARASEDETLAYRQWITALLDVADREPGRRDALMREAFEAAQWAGQQASGAAVAKMAARAGAGNAAVAAQVREQQDLALRLEHLERQLIEALSEPAPSRDQRRIDGLRREIEQGEARLNRLADEIARASPSFAGLMSPAPLALSDVQALLKADEALVVVFPHGEANTLAWTVTREGAGWHRLDLAGRELNEKVKGLREGLDVEDLAATAAAGRLFDLGLAHEVYARLLAPLLGPLQDKRHLLLVTSGSLTSVPFHLLVTEKPPVARPSAVQIRLYREAAWLARRHAVTTLPSVASLKSLRGVARGASAPRPLIGFGDPLFQTGTGAAKVAKGGAATPASRRSVGYAEAWRGASVDLAFLRRALTPLPETAAELGAVARALGAADSDIRLREAASEAAVKRADLSPYRVVYFATHGLVAGEVRGLAEPALTLTLPAEASALDDGLLTASEIASLKLNADWVVLSACNTGAGDRPGAEALSGLSRAFFYAGARSLLVSHWRVDSDAAVRLTTQTFATLAGDPAVGRSEALRRAMLAMIDDTTSPWHAYPDFWAALSVVGEGAGP